MEKVIKKLIKSKKKVNYALTEHEGFDLQWAPGQVPLALIEGLPEDRNAVKIEEVMFKPANNEDPI